LWLDLIARSNAQGDRYDASGYRRAVTPLLGIAPYAGDAQARAAIRLLLADREQRRDGARLKALLRPVADEAALPANHPLKTGALIRLASVAQQEGDATAARAAFERSGLSASQCAILDNRPTLQRAGGSFPQEAVAWGFEGWTRTQFDIEADGKVRNERAILSYPPFVFTKAGTETIRGATYSKTFRPDGAPGCGAETRNIRFTMGG
jgi:outer membrane biosynthesis protein TonB